MMLGIKYLIGLFNNSRRGIWDTLVSMAPQIVGVLTGFFGSVLIARGLGPQGLGRYALVMSLAGIAMTLSDLGIGQTAIRYASQAASTGNRAGLYEVLRWAFRVRILLVALVTGILTAASPLLARHVWHDEMLTVYLRLGLLGGVFAAMCSIPNLYFQSLKRFGANAAILSAQRVLVLLGILLLAWSGAWSLFRVLGVQIVGHAIAALVFLGSVPFAALVSRSDFIGRGRAIRRWLAPPEMQHPQDGAQPGFALPMILSTVIVLVTLQADVWAMGYLLSVEELGLYSAATRFTLPLAMLLGAINTALWPRASAVPAAAARRLLLRTFRLAAGAAAAVVLYAGIVPMLAPLIFGSVYSASVAPAQILCLGYAVAILSCPVGVVGYSFGMVRVYWIINLVQLAVVAIALIVLLPRLGVCGAAWSFLANATTGGVIVGIVLWRRLRTQQLG